MRARNQKSVSDLWEMRARYSTCAQDTRHPLRKIRREMRACKTWKNRASACVRCESNGRSVENALHREKYLTYRATQFKTRIGSVQDTCSTWNVMRDIGPRVNVCYIEKRKRESNNGRYYSFRRFFYYTRESKGIFLFTFYFSLVSFSPSPYFPTVTTVDELPFTRTEITYILQVSFFVQLT